MTSDLNVVGVTAYDPVLKTEDSELQGHSTAKWSIDEVATVLVIWVRKRVGRGRNDARAGVEGSAAF